MSNKYDYAHGKLGEAIGSMAGSSEKLTTRLGIAYSGHLVHLQKSDFPIELQPRFDALTIALSNKSPSRHFEGGSVAWTLMHMHPNRAKKLIQEIYDLEYSLAHLLQD